ncbi:MULTISPECIES: PAS domain-containing sensor histidine kinase [Dehalococcoides]|uniref:PAS domain-containing sensor histidine kinase n=1 Tax=Dehalococcoides TaxID=61434 RepID=UPI0003C8933F|nr:MULTISPECIES: PAS domain-containing sensor histidine kinase [Dehalococcoides]AHB14207.1 sensor histidine kinase [Dehalococcoides mccartyi GY50]AII58557.1 ATPase [Dehalococcoides mccartyi CG1]APH11677.1 PAS domain-containing sensor histidine kinase [Dehalococcoides mccartyi]UJP38224.1 PAS domain-containing sensor histidine kinase [Dehalococcoides mccartyi]BAQ35381.1 two-component sensor histidine kinase [Dehalococcoides sp. UCH007]
MEIDELKDEIAKLKQCNYALKKERLKYRELFNRANDAILLFKFNNPNEPVTITDANTAACKHFGYTYEELIGKTNLFIDSPETAIRGTEILNDLFIKGHEVLEIAHKNKNGESIPVEINHKIIYLAGDTMIISVIRDITARKKNEQELRESLEREKQLRETLENEISQRVTFMRALVHELKTPLTSMLATSELLSKNLKEEPNHSYIKCLYAGIQDLNLRVDELLDIARGEVGLLRLECEPLNIYELLKDVEEIIRPVFESNAQKLTISLQNSLPVVVADYKRLKQVILNLLDNAAKYTPLGGDIRLSAAAGNKYLVIEVKDNGKGMSPKETGALFKLYSRSNKKGSPSGLGIGLALSKMIVDLHEGEITVKSKLGEGSTFTFSIPLRPNAK